MNQIERIYTMIQYINNRGNFKLKELMDEFGISKSTALRDIQQIEAIGLPLVAAVGRGGGYSIMQNQLLPPLRFNQEEISALFVSLLATKNQQLPYLTSRLSLAEKVLGLLSAKEQDELIQLDEILAFDQTNTFNSGILDISDIASLQTEKLLQAAAKSKFVRVSYLQRNQKTNTFSSIEKKCYLKRIFHHARSWLVSFIELEAKHSLLINAEQIEAIEPIVVKGLKLDNLIKEVRKNERPNLILELGPKALEQFRSYHPVGVGVTFLDAFQTRGKISCYINVTDAEQVELFTNWLLFLGTELKIISLPGKSKIALRDRYARFM